MRQEGIVYLFNVLTEWQEYTYHIKDTDGKKTGDVLIYEYWYEMPQSLLFFACAYRVYNRLKTYIVRTFKEQSNRAISIDQMTESETPEELIGRIAEKADKAIDAGLTLDMLRSKLSAAQYRLLEKLVENGSTHHVSGDSYKLLKKNIQGMQLDRETLLQSIKAIKERKTLTAGYAADITAEMALKADKAILADMVYRLA
jgi:hypothetical protein